MGLLERKRHFGYNSVVSKKVMAFLIGVVMGKYIEVTFIITPEEGQYASVCVETGTASCGDTVEEATKNLREAVLLHLSTLESLGERPRFFKERGIEMKSKPKRQRYPLPAKNLELPSYDSFVTKNAIPIGA